MQHVTTTSGGTLPQVLCCLCGVLMMEPNAVNTCASCLASTSDITKGISTQATLHQCRGCQRWHANNKKTDSVGGLWIACELESRELLALCLSNVSGLRSKNKNDKNKSDRARLVDAAWIWTEPHSMRLKVRLTLQKQVQLGTVLQQSLVVEFIVRNQQCIECQAVFRQGSWKSLVQVRQRVSHKRTFLYLEQLILKHGAHRGCLRIETFQDGMDFYFPDKGKAARFISFLECGVPIRITTSKKLISTDCKSNTANFKFTNMVEICPLCKDDLVHLPKQLARSLGNISRLVLVKNITNWIHLIDPLSGQTASMTGEAYWRNQEHLRPLITAARSRLTRFLVLNKEAVYLRPNASKRQKHSNSGKKHRSRLAQVTLAREDELDTCSSSQRGGGVQEQPQFADEVSHIGYLLKAGDVCVGYNLRETQLVDDEAEELRERGKLPDVVVVRKLYGGATVSPAATTTSNGDDPISSSSKEKHRIWRLERLEVDVVESSSTKKKKNNSSDMDVDVDEEDFLQEVEADREMRQNINLYKSEILLKKLQLQDNNMIKESSVMDKGDGDDKNEEDDHDGADGDDDDDGDDDQQVKLDELLDGLALDAGPDDPNHDSKNSNNNDSKPRIEENDEMVETIIEEGQRARQDGIAYVSREAARSVRDKDVPVHVVDGLGEDYLQKTKQK